MTDLDLLEAAAVLIRPVVPPTPEKPLSSVKEYCMPQRTMP